MKMICVGRNYTAHARELSNEVPEAPVLFMKPQTALIQQSKDIFIPDFTKDLHYECELVVRIGRSGKHIQEKFAHKYIQGIGLGLDLTARDVQAAQKAKGLPWEIAKAFDGSALTGIFTDADTFPELDNIHFILELNSKTVQTGYTADMIYTIPYVIAYASQFFTLNTGDLIFTGTPAGVGPLHAGDRLRGVLQGVEQFSVSVR